MSKTQTAIVEPPAAHTAGSKDVLPSRDVSLHSLDIQGIRLGESTPPIDSEPGTPDGARVFRVQEHWNNPRKNIYKLACVFFSFINFGMNDACYGALLPSLQPYYSKTYTWSWPKVTAPILIRFSDVNYTIVSLVFLAPFAGYTVAALISNKVHEHLGRRGIAVFGVLPRLIAYVVISVHPPYPVVVAILAFAGLGNGLIEAGWNAYVGNLNAANELLGFLHGFYGLGATISPLIIAALVNTYHLHW